ncbi:MAG: 50S ribosomal protein L20 [Planctomycetota bacterium]|nr:50S ribosomal protein L20 [Planctomycetota bacterium]MEE2712068.1 50S ribosomal protein L20 [Planctomycetota bacterium]
MRATSATARHRRHKRVLKDAKGYRGSRSKLYRIAKETLMRAGNYAYRDRRNKKRSFRRLWIVRINAAARDGGMSYSAFMAGLKKVGVGIDRKQLSDIAIHDPATFSALVDMARQAG